MGWSAPLSLPGWPTYWWTSMPGQPPATIIHGVAVKAVQQWPPAHHHLQATDLSCQGTLPQGSRLHPRWYVLSVWFRLLLPNAEPERQSCEGCSGERPIPAPTSRPPLLFVADAHTSTKLYRTTPLAGVLFAGKATSLCCMIETIRSPVVAAIRAPAGGPLPKPWTDYEVPYRLAQI